MPHPPIADLALSPHPEGGWYRETLRRPDPEGGRDRMTAILFLLEAGQRSHWHRVDADELWLWHSGASLRLSIAGDAGVEEHELSAGSPQKLVSAGAWQAAASDGDYSLVSCVVVPGFDFAGFELAPAGWEPGSI